MPIVTVRFFGYEIRALHENGADQFVRSNCCVHILILNGFKKNEFRVVLPQWIAVDTFSAHRTTCNLHILRK